MKHYDDTINQVIDVPAKQVACECSPCVNYGIPIEVPDHPTVIVQCGPCQQWIIPPKEAS